MKHTIAFYTTRHHLILGKDAVFAERARETRHKCFSAEIVCNLAETTEGCDAQLIVKTQDLKLEASAWRRDRHRR